MADPFSGKAGRNAAVWQANYLDSQQNNINNQIKQGQTSAIGAVNTGQTRSLKSLGTGYNNAINRFQPYADTGLKAFNQYADATGVNGQAGYDNAANNFRASPGYQWQVDQATDAAARKAASLGMGASGNTLSALTRLGSNLADQEYGQYLDRLKGIGQMGYNATGQQAGLTTQLANQRANVYTNAANNRANIYQHGTDLGVSSTQNTANQIANAGQKGMMAGQEAAATRMKAGMQVGGMVLGALGGPIGMMGSGLLSGLGGSLFGAGGGTGQFEYPQNYR